VRLIFIYFITVVFTCLYAVELKPVKLELKWKHQFQFAGYYMAKEKGFYKDVGLDVEIIEGHDKNTIADIEDAKVDFAITTSRLVREVINGKKFVALASIFQNSPFTWVVKKDSGIKTLDDFVGKTLMRPVYSLDDVDLMAMLKMNNIDTTKLKFIPTSYNMNDLLDEKCDVFSAYVSNEPYELEKLGIEYTLFRPVEYGVDFYGDTLFTSLEILNKRPELVRKFREASLKGWKYAFDNMEESVRLVHEKYNKEFTLSHLRYEASVLKEQSLYPFIAIGTMDINRWKTIAQTFKNFGYLKSTDIPSYFMYDEDKYKLRKSIINWVSIVIIIFLVFGAILIFLFRKHSKYLNKLVKEKTKELRFHEEHLEEEVKVRTRELEIATRTKSDFLANMSHEIRTPLNAIIGFVDILYKDETDKEKQKKLKIINQSGHSLLTIINDILDFSKIENNKLLIEQNPLNIRDTFTDIVNLFFDKAKEKELSLKIKIDENLPVTMIGDIVRIKQVFSNLLSNAIKFSKDSKKIDISLKYIEPENKLYCEVKDYGIGIADDKISNIFESFVQEDSSTTRKYGGTGLGLSISKVLVELMGGEIGIKSKLTKGSIFYFIMPLIEVCEINSEEVLDNVESELFGNILIVEDNKSNQMLMDILLEELGLDSDIANDGLEAVEIMRVDASKYDLILMDENMPNMNGMEATKIIKNMDAAKDIPIIAVTANAIKGDREKFLEAGMDDYLSKPIDAKALEITLRKYL